jgi:hypothetical protein
MQMATILHITELDRHSSSAEEQHAMDQQKCTGFGFTTGTDAFAQSMMGIDSQREAQTAADRRAAADREAANQRAQAALKAAQDKADQDAWDKKTGQGAYSSSTSPGSSSVSSPNPTDAVRNAVQQDIDNINSQNSAW